MKLEMRCDIGKIQKTSPHKYVTYHILSHSSLQDPGCASLMQPSTVLKRKSTLHRLWACQAAEHPGEFVALLLYRGAVF